MALFDTIPKVMSINDIAGHLFILPVKVQFCHHLTSSYAAHKALDGLYDTINSMKDEIIEKVMGYTNTKYSELNLSKISNFKEADCKSIAYEVMNYGKQLEEWAGKQGWCDIENLAQSYSGAGAQCVFLLNLT